jgi:integrase
MAGQPSLAIGEVRKKPTVKVGKDKWRACSSYGAADGKTKRCQKDRPTKRAAEKAVAEEIEARLGVEANGRIKPDTLMTELLDVVMREQVTNAGSRYALRSQDTYRRAARILRPRLGEWRVSEATTRRLTLLAMKVRDDHGHTTARLCLTLLRLMCRLALLEGACVVNVARPVELERSGENVGGKARSLSEADLAAILEGLQTSTALVPKRKDTAKDEVRTVAQFVADNDLFEPMMVLAATGLRRSELLAVVWDDFDDVAGTLAVRSHVVRAFDDDYKSRLVHEATTKTEGSAGLVPLPAEVVSMLKKRRFRMGQGMSVLPGVPPLIFPSLYGGVRDPDAFAKAWRMVRGGIGYPDVNLHMFRSTVGTLVKDALGSRVAADQLGHANVSMLEDRYVGRGSVHHAAAEVMGRALRGEGSRTGDAGRDVG